MVVALATGFASTVLTLWLGVRFFGVPPRDILVAVAASNLAGFVSGLSTLALERQPSVRKVLLGHPIKAWAMLSSLYTLVLVSFSPPSITELRVLVPLYWPLVFCTGLMLPLFGPAQDRLIRRAQRRVKA
jgi:hypothetical protein